MFENLKKDDKISVFSNRSGFDYARVFFIRQSDDSITILDYVPNVEIEIPKAYIVEIAKH